MFGNDNSQSPYTVASATPANNEEIMKNGSLEQADTITSGQASGGETESAGSPSSVFPPSGASDPFGTAQPTQTTSTDDDDVVANGTDTTSVAPAKNDEPLLDIKQQALQHLSPLVQHLDQSPEDKFKTMMMMIQASDDKSLVPAAFEAAQQIDNDKDRAQALLDIINEINYFTQ